MAGHHHQLQISGAVVDCQRAQQGAGQCPQLRCVLADEAESWLRTQAQHFRNAANPALFQDEVAQRPACHGFEFFTDRDFGPLQGYARVGGRLNADAESYIEEVRIGCPPLPHPGSTDDVSELLRIAVHKCMATALLAGCPLDLVPVLVELTQVASALLLLFTPGDAPGAAKPAAEHQRTETDESDHRKQAGLQGPHTGGVHHQNRAQDAHQECRGGDHQQDVARFPLRQSQWCGDGDPQRRHRRNGRPNASNEALLRHLSLPRRPSAAHR